MTHNRIEGRPPKAGPKNEVTYQLKTNIFTDLYNYCSTTERGLSNAETFFNLVERVEIIPGAGEKCIWRSYIPGTGDLWHLYISGKDRPLEIDEGRIENYHVFRGTYYRTFGEWPPMIADRLWSLVLDALAELKTEFHKEGGYEHRC
jgi:hypothetical protein